MVLKTTVLAILKFTTEPSIPLMKVNFIVERFLNVGFNVLVSLLYSGLSVTPYTTDVDMRGAINNKGFLKVPHNPPILALLSSIIWQLMSPFPIFLQRGTHLNKLSSINCHIYPLLSTMAFSSLSVQHIHLSICLFPPLTIIIEVHLSKDLIRPLLRRGLIFWHLHHR